MVDLSQLLAPGVAWAALEVGFLGFLLLEGSFGFLRISFGSFGLLRALPVSLGILWAP